MIKIDIHKIEYQSKNKTLIWNKYPYKENKNQ